MPDELLLLLEKVEKENGNGPPVNAYVAVEDFRPPK